MMRNPVLAILITFLAISAVVYPANITDYETIAISSPLITQIYTNPELSPNKDLELAPETQILLYENFADKLCQALKERFKSKVEFVCLNDIQGKLDTDAWNDFNRLFSGQNGVNQDTARVFAKMLGVEAFLNSYLMFSYYENSDSERHLDVHFEWYLVDAISGEDRVDGKFDCSDDFANETEAAEKEADCFMGIIKSIGEIER
jgi:hypothetical protein